VKTIQYYGIDLKDKLTGYLLASTEEVVWMQPSRLRICSDIIFFVLLIVILFSSGNYAIAGELFQTSSTVQSYQESSSSEGEMKQSAASQEKESETADKSFILHQLYDDFTYLLSEPDFYLTMGGLGLGPSIFPKAFKNESPEFTEHWGASVFADGFFEVGETVGDGRFAIVVSATTWGIGKITGSSRLRTFGSDLFQAQAINGFLTVVLKGSVKRTRPNGAPYSYPSGHTSSAFATAGTVYAHFGKTWGIPAFVFAGYVGLSRLQEGKHYLSDVIAGGIMGTYVSLKLSRRPRAKAPLSVAPLIIGNGVGVTLSFRF